MNADENSEGTVDRGQRLEHPRVRRRGQLESAVFFRDGESQHPDLRKCANDILRNRLLFVESAGINQITVHAAKLVDQPANSPRFIGIPLIEPAGVREEKRIEYDAREYPTGERWILVSHSEVALAIASRLTPPSAQHHVVSASASG